MLIINNNKKEDGEQNQDKYNFNRKHVIKLGITLRKEASKYKYELRTKNKDDSSEQTVKTSPETLQTYLNRNKQDKCH